MESWNIITPWLVACLIFWLIIEVLFFSEHGFIVILMMKGEKSCILNSEIGNMYFDPEILTHVFKIFMGSLHLL